MRESFTKFSAINGDRASLFLPSAVSWRFSPFSALRCLMLLWSGCAGVMPITSTMASPSSVSVGTAMQAVMTGIHSTTRLVAYEPVRRAFCFVMTVLRQQTSWSTSPGAGSPRRSTSKGRMPRSRWDITASRVLISSGATLWPTRLGTCWSLRWVGLWVLVFLCLHFVGPGGCAVGVCALRYVRGSVYDGCVCAPTFKQG